MNSVIELDGNRFVDFESMRADVQSIKLLTEKMKAIDTFNEDDFDDSNIIENKVDNFTNILLAAFVQKCLS